MPSIGTEINVSNLKSVIEDNQFKNRNHYFYMIQMPDCGSNRIKIGKSSNIQARFSYYQNHFHGTNVRVLDLRRLPKNMTDRYGDKGEMLYTLFEREVIYYLREFNKKKTKSGLGMLTEWFDADTKSRLQNKYEKFLQEFPTMKIDKWRRREMPRIRHDGNLSDSSSSDEEEEVREQPKRDRKKPARYKP